jgi:Domain of unknown function (DUF4397)
MKNSFLTIAICAFAALSVVTTSCKKDDPVVAVDKARVLVVHASPNAPAVDLLVDSVKVGTALAFPNNTGYLTVNAGKRNIRVNPTGTAASVIAADVTFAKDKNYTVFAIDSVIKITPLVLEDNLAAPAAGKAHVRFVHLSPNAPAVDIALKGGAVVFANTAFKGSKDFTPLDAKTYDLEVRVAGTTPVVLALPGIKLEAGKIYTVFARGFLSGTGAQALNAEIIEHKK